MGFDEYIDKGTRRAVGFILASVLIFNGLVRIPKLGTYLDKYPLIVLGLGVGIIFLLSKDK